MKKQIYPKISIKEAKALSEKLEGKKDTEFYERFMSDLIILSDGRAILLTESQGVIYPSKNELLKFYNDAVTETKRINSEYPYGKHILTDIFPYGDNFLDFDSFFIKNIFNILKIPSIRLDFSLASLKFLDEALVKKNGEGFANIYPAVTWYVGMVIQKSSNGKWIFRKVQNGKNSSVTAPFVIGANGVVHEPFLVVYKELFENNYEIGKISIYEGVIAELQRKN